MVVRSACKNLKALLLKSRRQRLGVFDHLLLIRLKFRL